MQWIKTLIMFLALFLGGGASNAQPHTHGTAKNEPSSINTEISSFLSQIEIIKSLILLISSNNQELVSHTDKIPSTGKKVKYRCGSKRCKNFHHVNPINFASTITQAAHRHTKYCCGRFCCGKKSWKEHHTENNAKSPDPGWVCQFQDDQSTTNGVEPSWPPPNNDFMLLPEAVIHSRHESLSVIAPRE